MSDKSFKNQKGDPCIYGILRKYGNEMQAKSRARMLRKKYSGTNYAAQKPCTTVDLLVEELEHPEALLHATSRIQTSL